MSTSLKDFLDFVVLWLKKRTGVHLGELVVYPAMVRHCLCCHAGSSYAEQTNALCRKCAAEQHCTMCKSTFTPSDDSVGVFCPSCWAQLEATWKTRFDTDGVAAAESSVRSAVTASRPTLMSCAHRG